MVPSKHTERQSLVPRQRIDDCVEIHILHSELCDRLLSRHRSVPLSRLSMRLLQEALVICVLTHVSQFRLHNGYNHTHVKRKLIRKHKRAYRSSWSRAGNQESFTLIISSNLAVLVKNYPGIIVRQHRTDRKQMELLREQCAE